MQVHRSANSVQQNRRRPSSIEIKEQTTRLRHRGIRQGHAVLLAAGAADAVADPVPAAPRARVRLPRRAGRPLVAVTQALDTHPHGPAAPYWIGLRPEDRAARLAELRQWADTILRREYGGYPLPACWASHPHAIWELSTLAAEWHRTPRPNQKPRPAVTAPGRFQCALTLSDEPKCTTYARVTVTDTTGDSARACTTHAIRGLEGIDGARVDWADTKGLNEYERKALELTEEVTRGRTPRATGDAKPQAETAGGEPEIGS
jgi:hypothetical protein